MMISGVPFGGIGPITILLEPTSEPKMAYCQNGPVPTGGGRGVGRGDDVGRGLGVGVAAAVGVRVVLRVRCLREFLARAIASRLLRSYWIR